MWEVRGWGTAVGAYGRRQSQQAAIALELRIGAVRALPEAVETACFRVLQEAKRLAPSRPVFLLTAYDLPEFRQRAQQLGADGYLVKPIPTDALLSLLPAAYWK